MLTSSVLILAICNCKLEIKSSETFERSLTERQAVLDRSKHTMANLGWPESIEVQSEEAPRMVPRQYREMWVATRSGR
jgi:hypothetical protein